MDLKWHVVAPRVQQYNNRGGISTACSSSIRFVLRKQGSLIRYVSCYLKTCVFSVFFQAARAESWVSEIMGQVISGHCTGNDVVVQSADVNWLSGAADYMPFLIINTHTLLPQYVRMA